MNQPLYFISGVNDLSNTLTTGGFIATLAALLLAVVAYIISRKAQLDARKHQQAVAAGEKEGGPSTLMEPPAGGAKPKEAGKPAAKSRAARDNDPTVYRWD